MQKKMNHFYTTPFFIFFFLLLSQVVGGFLNADFNVVLIVTGEIF